jgi:hypothetical protein
VSRSTPIFCSAGIIWPRWPNAVLNHALAGDFELVLPEIVILEARRHVARDFPEFRERFERLLAALAYDLAPLPEP